MIVQEGGRNRLVLIDYGAADVQERSKIPDGKDSGNCCFNDCVGSIGFTAPEIWVSSKVERYPPHLDQDGAVLGSAQRTDTYGTKSDWWSMGILILGLLIGKGENAPPNSVNNELLECSVWLDKWPATSFDEFIDFIPFIKDQDKVETYLLERLQNAVPTSLLSEEKREFVKSLLKWDQDVRCHASLVGEGGRNCRTLKWEGCAAENVNNFFGVEICDKTFPDSLDLFGEAISSVSQFWKPPPPEGMLQPKEFILFQGWLEKREVRGRRQKFKWVVITADGKCYLFHWRRDLSLSKPSLEERQRKTP